MVKMFTRLECTTLH